MKLKKHLIGIDYGSKLAGTTAIAISNGQKIDLLLSEKKRDADAFLQEVMQESKNAMVFIDAPLSLPGVYFGLEKADDYFYRESDLAMKAMSPMFLGGLTARAMKLRAKLETDKRKFFETYPARQADRLGLKDLGYKQKGLVGCVALLQSKFDLKFPEVSNWHMFDALLALHGASRHAKGDAEFFGNETEGGIWI